jgi:NAD(P)-dependent dehydrogenase (short-subunit alcohol dehydrogenase family)
MSNLNGKAALVTGASKGIGAGVARALGAAGASVAVNYASDKAGADKLVADIARAEARRWRYRAICQNPPTSRGCSPRPRKRSGAWTS